MRGGAGTQTYDDGVIRVYEVSSTRARQTRVRGDDDTAAHDVTSYSAAFLAETPVQNDARRRKPLNEKP